MMNAVLWCVSKWRRALLSLKNYGCVNLSRPLTLHNQEGSSLEIQVQFSEFLWFQSWDCFSSQVCQVASFSFLLYYWEGTACWGKRWPRSVSIKKNCTSRIVAAPKKRKSRRPGVYWVPRALLLCGHRSRSSGFRKPSPEKTYTYVGICHMVYHTPPFLAFTSHLHKSNRVVNPPSLLSPYLSLIP